MAEAEVHCEMQGACGLVTLQRPQALNALTLRMVHGLAAALDAWEHDPQVRAVVVRGSGGKAFSAGGDIRALYDQGRAGNFVAQLDFWRAEYVLNRRIKLYPKPYVALIDGFIMGGGAGVGLHGSHRVAGDRFSFAMPEVGIGFFPDIGATYFLPRMPDHVGTYLALTGARVATGDAVALGLADAHVPSARFDAVVAGLVAGREVADILAAERVAPPPPTLDAARPLVDRCFAHPDLLQILAALDSEAKAGSTFAGSTRDTIRTKSPTSLAIALRQMQTGAGLDLASALQTEFRIVTRIARGMDFYEGVRATLIDRDSAPRWTPATIEDLDPSAVAAYFALLPPQDELVFDASVHP